MALTAPPARRPLTAVVAALTAATVVLWPATSAGATDVAIAAVNPSSASGPGTVLADRPDGTDARYRLVAHATDVPDGARVEAHVDDADPGHETDWVVALQPLAPAPGTFQALWDVPEDAATGPGRVTFVVTDGEASLAADAVEVVLEPARTTFAITGPAAGAAAGFSGGTAVVEGTTSDDATDLDLYYTTAGAGQRPVWVKCGRGEVTDGTFSTSCALHNNHRGEQVTFFGVQSSTTGQQTSGDVQRVNATSTPAEDTGERGGGDDAGDTGTGESDGDEAEGSEGDGIDDTDGDDAPTGESDRDDAEGTDGDDAPAGDPETGGGDSESDEGDTDDAEPTDAAGDESGAEDPAADEVEADGSASQDSDEESDATQDEDDRADDGRAEETADADDTAEDTTEDDSQTGDTGDTGDADGTDETTDTDETGDSDGTDETGDVGETGDGYSADETTGASGTDTGDDDNAGAGDDDADGGTASTGTESTGDGDDAGDTGEGEDADSRDDADTTADSGDAGTSGGETTGSTGTTTEGTGTTTSGSTADTPTTGDGASGQSRDSEVAASDTRRSSDLTAAGSGGTAAHPASTVEAGRIAGTDPIGTAVAASQASFPQAGSASVAVLARGDEPHGFADALAGTPLAVKRDGPLLITMPGELHPDTEAELQRVLPRGQTVLLLGGPVALHPRVEARVRELGYQTRRIAGADRYETAVEIAEALGNPSSLLLARGTTFPDAITAAAAAVEVDGAVLLSEDTHRTPVTERYLGDHSDAAVYAVGEPMAGLFPGATPVAGADRYDTARQVAERFFSAPPAVGVARGDRFTDALTGSAHVGRRGGPMLLTRPAPAGLAAAPADYVCQHAPDVADTFVYGGRLALTPEVEAQLEDHARGVGCANG